MTSNLVDDFAAALGSMAPVLLRAVEAMLPFALFAKRLKRDGHKTTAPRLRRGRHGRARWALRRMDTEPRVWQGQPASDAAIARYMKARRYHRAIDPRRRGLVQSGMRFTPHGFHRTANRRGTLWSWLWVHELMERWVDDFVERRTLMSTNPSSIDTSAGHVEGVEG